MRKPPEKARAANGASFVAPAKPTKRPRPQCGLPKSAPSSSQIVRASVDGPVTNNVLRRFSGLRLWLRKTFEICVASVLASSGWPFPAKIMKRGMPWRSATSRSFSGYARSQFSAMGPGLRSASTHHPPT